MKYLEEVTKQTSEDMRKPANVGKLDTYERAIIHEYMHVDMFKFREHSKVTTLPRQSDLTPVSRGRGSNTVRKLRHGYARLR
jgi:UDP-N-acetylglucosamine pyrophosphorylase